LEINMKLEPGNIYVISMSGEFDLFEQEKANKLLTDIYAQNPSVIIMDLSEISFMDSTGVGLVITYYAKLKENEIGMALVLNANAHVMRRLGKLLLLTDPTLKFYDTVEEAIGDIDINKRLH
jgi:anti-sigma B factor antagonist